MPDTSSWLRGEASIDEFLADPIVQLVMRSDRVSVGELRALLRTASARLTRAAREGHEAARQEVAMDIKKGDRVRFKRSSTLGVGQQRQGQIGTVIEVYDDLPAQGGPRVDINFADGGIERGISAHQIEHA